MNITIAFPSKATKMAHNTNIYILRLTGGNFYVGKSQDVCKRFQEHMKGKGSTWTKIYKPLSIETTIYNTTPFDEDKITKQYMLKYGIDRVRGGTYVREILTESQKNHIQAEIWSASNRCTKCGSIRHFAKNCRSKSPQPQMQ